MRVHASCGNPINPNGWCVFCGKHINARAEETTTNNDWAHQGETGRRSEAYKDLVETVEHTLRMSGNELIQGKSRDVAERIVYHLVDVLGMMPESAARTLVDKLKREARIMTEDCDSLGAAGSVG